MTKWAIETRVTSRRLYIVEAANEKEAEAKSCECASSIDEDTDEETLSIVQLVETPPS